MNFIKDVTGVLYPSSQIMSIRRGKWKPDNPTHRESARVFLADESIVTVDDDEINGLLRSADPVVPAQPGFAVLGYYYFDTEESEDLPYVEVDPVVAWRIDEINQAHPIVSDPSFDGMTGLHAVLRPDGTAVDLFGAVFESREAWEDRMKLDREDERSRRAASAPDQSPHT